MITQRVQRILFASIFVVASIMNGWAQEEVFYMYGEIWDMDTRVVVPNGSVSVIDVDDSTSVLIGKADARGRYDLALPLDRKFKVLFNSPGYVSRYVMVDLTGMDDRYKIGDHGINVQPSLMRPVDEIDYSLLHEKPFGICRLDRKGKGFDWDEAYTQENIKEFQTILDLHTQKRKALEAGN